MHVFDGNKLEKVAQREQPNVAFYDLANIGNSID